MNRLCGGLALVTALVLSTAAMAGGSTEETEDHDIEGVAGKRLPELGDVPKATDTTWRVDSVAEQNERPYDNVVYVGARVLDLHPDYVQGTRDGFAMVFRREYKGARKHFVVLDEKFPGTGISASIDAFVWQALMLENFDFRYDRQYELSNKRAMAELKVALKDPAHQGWEHFQLAGLVGIEAIHMIRHGSYIPALNRAFEAMDHAQAARLAAPDFVDLDIADGMYNYWRTVVTMSSKMLPDFGDQRAEGIQQIKNVEAGGIFLSDPATLALAFSWLEERKFKEAATACAKNRRKYPNNVINNLLAGQAFIYQRKYDSAIAVYDHVLTVAPENNRVHYYLGLANMRKGDSRTAITHYERYLASDHLEAYQLASGHYRLGQANYRVKSYKTAEEQYKLSVKVNGFKPAKRALSRMRDLRKEGKISY
ncbi:MAG: tetratricopeptide (TPR) repeat protein [Kiritimatiellia bacterium]|jgi:tetratricopeptide (TPR) repeat protein